MKRLLSIGVLTSFGFLAVLASGSDRDRDASAWPGSVLITNDDGIDRPGIRALAESDTWRSTFGVRGELDPHGDWAALRRGAIVITPMRIGEMEPLERYQRMLGAVPWPIGDGR